MPPLKTYLRNHMLGGDDLFIPSLIELPIVGLWLAWHKYDEGALEGCGGGCMAWGFAHFPLLATLMSIQLGLTFSVAWYSIRGTILNDCPRQPLQYLVDLKFLIYIAITIFSFFISVQCFSCLRGSIIKSLFTFFWITVASVNNWHWFIPTSNIQQLLISVIPGYWIERILSYISSTLDFHRINDMEAISDAISLFLQIFKEKVNVAISDLFSASIILSEHQQKKYNQMGAEKFQQLSEQEEVSWMTPLNAEYFLPYAIAIYGWKTYIFFGPKLILCIIGQMFHQILYILRLEVQPAYPEIEGDNFLHLNSCAFCILSGIRRRQDLVYMYLKNQVFQSPFALIIDHQAKAVIIAIRGSMSLADIITNLNATDSQLKINGYGHVGLHKGMNETASILYNLIFEQNEKKENSLISNAYKRVADEKGEDEAQKYNLVIVGNSLGAAIASILCLHVLNNTNYQVQCYAFSPPPSCSDENFAVKSSKIIYSIILEDDFVARLTVRTFLQLKIRLLKILIDCDIQKLKILNTWLWQKLSDLFGLEAASSFCPDTHESASTVSAAGNLPGLRDGYTLSDNVLDQLITRIDSNLKAASSVQDLVKDYLNVASHSGSAQSESLPFCALKHQAHLKEVIESSSIEMAKHKRYYLLGSIFIIRENFVRTFMGTKEPFYEWHQVHPGSAMLSELVLNENTFRHHMPHIMRRALLKIIHTIRFRDA